MYYTYENSNWPDQLTSYAGQTITYDNSGNPLNYINGISFICERDRQLSQITMSDNNNRYNKYKVSTIHKYLLLTFKEERAK